MSLTVNGSRRVRHLPGETLIMNRRTFTGCEVTVTLEGWTAAPPRGLLLARLMAQESTNETVVDQDAAQIDAQAPAIEQHLTRSGRR
jgi:hypothetical protein